MPNACRRSRLAPSSYQFVWVPPPPELGPPGFTPRPTKYWNLENLRFVSWGCGAMGLRIVMYADSRLAMMPSFAGQHAHIRSCKHEVHENVLL